MSETSCERFQNRQAGGPFATPPPQRFRNVATGETLARWPGGVRAAREPVLVGCQPHLDAGFIVQGEAIDDVGAGAIVADDLHLAPIATQARDDLVEGADARNVPEVGARNVDQNVSGDGLALEGAGEAI